MAKTVFPGSSLTCRVHVVIDFNWPGEDDTILDMVLAKISQGHIEVQGPIPASWEGQMVRLIPLTPDDLVSDLDERLAALHDLGPMEFEPGERETITQALEQFNRSSKDILNQLPTCP